MGVLSQRRPWHRSGDCPDSLAIGRRLIRLRRRHFSKFQAFRFFAALGIAEEFERDLLALGRFLQNHFEPPELVTVQRFWMSYDGPAAIRRNVTRIPGS